MCPSLIFYDNNYNIAELSHFWKLHLMKTSRLDNIMVERGLSISRSAAQRFIMEGKVRVNDQVVLKASHPINGNEIITLAENPKYVSRGGDKLEGAIIAFNLDVRGYCCADVGASTGGFTDCLLQYGAEKVYAIDVGYGILDWKLRSNSKVVAMERQNARFVEVLPEKVNFITIDASFISLGKLLPVVKNWFGDGKGELVTLIKPQFEAGRREVNKGEGVITNPLIHYRIVKDLIAEAQTVGFEPLGITTSPLKGPKGNIEFLAYFQFPATQIIDVCSFIETQLPDLSAQGKTE